MSETFNAIGIFPYPYVSLQSINEIPWKCLLLVRSYFLCLVRLTKNIRNTPLNWNLNKCLSCKVFMGIIQFILLLLSQMNTFYQILKTKIICLKITFPNNVLNLIFKPYITPKSPIPIFHLLCIYRHFAYPWRESAD